MVQILGVAEDLDGLTHLCRLQHAVYVGLRRDTSQPTADLSLYIPGITLEEAHIELATSTIVGCGEPHHTTLHTRLDELVCEVALMLVGLDVAPSRGDTVGTGVCASTSEAILCCLGVVDLGGKRLVLLRIPLGAMLAIATHELTLSVETNPGVVSLEASLEVDCGLPRHDDVGTKQQRARH